MLPTLPTPPAPGAAAPEPPEPLEIRPVYMDAARGMQDAPVYAGIDLVPGHVLAGPLVVEEQTTTIFAGPGDRVDIDHAGNYLIHLGES